MDIYRCFQIMFIGVLIILVNCYLASKAKLNLKGWTHYIICYYYGFVFLVSFMITSITGDEVYYFYNLYDDYEFIMYLACVLAMSISVFLGCHTKVRIPMIFEYKDKIFLYNKDIFWNRLYRYSTIMMLISIFLYYLYSMAYGGFFGLLEQTMYIRSGIFNISNPLSFLQKFGSLGVMASYCLYAVWLNTKLSKALRVKAFLTWLAAFVYSNFVAFSQGGRSEFVLMGLVYILTISLPIYNNIYELIFKNIHKFAVLIGVFMIVNAMHNRADATSLGRFFAYGYGYLFSSFITSLKNGQFLYFQDFFTSPLAFLPSKVTSDLGLINTNAYNTFLITGGFKGDQSITGTYTTGLLSFSYYQLGIIGVIVVAFFYGLCIRQWSKRILLMDNTPFKYMLYSFYISIIFGCIVSNGIPQYLVLACFGYLAFFYGLKLYLFLIGDSI